MEELYEVLGVSDVADKDEVGNDDVKIIDNGQIRNDIKSIRAGKEGYQKYENGFYVDRKWCPLLGKRKRRKLGCMSFKLMILL